MPNLDLLVRADDQASRQLGRVTENLKKAGKAGEVHGRAIAKGSRQADKALKQTAKASKQAAKQASALSGAAISLKSSLLGLIGTAAVIGFLRSISSEFLQSERAVVRLNNSLKLTGEFTPLLSKKIQDLSRTLELQTGISSDAILNLFSLARGFANSADQAEELLKASLDFAVGADLQVTEALRRLGRALKGQAADAANFKDEIRFLTKAELAAGGATRLIQERFRGAAAELGKTLRGTIQLSQKFGDLKVKLADELLPVFDFWVEALDTATDSLNKLFGVSDDDLKGRDLTIRSLKQEIEQREEQIKRIREGDRALRGTGEVNKRIIAFLEQGIAVRRKAIETERLKSEAEAAANRKAKVIGDETKARTDAEKKGLQSLFDLSQTLRFERLQAEGTDSEIARERIRIDLETRIAAINQAFEVAGSRDTALRDIAVANAEATSEAQRAALQKQEFALSALGQASKGVTDQIASNFASAAADSIVSGKSLEDGLKGVFDSILKSAIETFIQIRIQAAFLAAFTPGGVGFFGGLLGGGGGFKHGTQRVPGPVGSPQLAVVHGGEEIRSAGGTSPAGPGGGGGGPLIGVLNLQVADLGPSERRKVVMALTEEIRAATDAGRVFASETVLASERNVDRSS